MAAVDVILLAVLVASVGLGLWRGLLYEVLSVLGWLAAFVVAYHGAPTVAAWLPMSDWGEPLRYAAGFAVLLVLTAFAGGALASLARRGAQAAGLRPVDRALGGLFGVARGVLLLLAAALLVWQTPWADSAPWREAQGPRWLERALAGFKPLVPDSVAVYFP